MKKRLSADAIKAVSSHYLQEGRKQESWVIQWIEVDENSLLAQVAMTSIYKPTGSTGDPQFHLTIFSTLEFASQLMIIYAHNWAGLNQKTREGWMAESTIRTVRAIRNPHDIRVAMQVRKMRQRGEHLYCVADFTVTDDSDGWFEVTLKGFLS